MSALHKALGQSNLVVNAPFYVKWSVMSFILKLRQFDVVYLNWIESIPDYRWGRTKSVIFIFALALMKICGKKIVWTLHNRQPHASGHALLKRWIFSLMVRNSDAIVTHAQEGLEIIERIYPPALSRAKYFPPPFRPPLDPVNLREADFKYEAILWGTVDRYKGVLEFLRYASSKAELKRMRFLICGMFSDDEYYRQCVSSAWENVTVENLRVPFDQLPAKIEQSRLILFVYRPESILSSGVLAESLRYSRPILGPAVGQFSDLAGRGLISTYDSFDDIAPKMNFILSQGHFDMDARNAYFKSYGPANFYAFISKIVDGLWS